MRSVSVCGIEAAQDDDALAQAVIIEDGAGAPVGEAQSPAPHATMLNAISSGL